MRRLLALLIGDRRVFVGGPIHANRGRCERSPDDFEFGFLQRLREAGL